MKLLLASICLLLASCAAYDDYMVVYAGDSIEVQSITADGPNDATGVGWNRKTKEAYLVYANGERTNLKVVGGGIGNGVFLLVLENGSRISVDLKTGKVTTEEESKFTK